MAVSPASLNTLSATEVAILAQAELIIDKELKLNYVPGKPTPIRSALLIIVTVENPRVMTALKADYVALGWSVTDYEGKEGAYLLFKD